ncbi:MAG: TetR/AcrR family transcriptional regulator [Eubacteriaceae bacterium]|nr:TetR/AcrR family transcriptional regulator [Eubacteriaceae bacterium]
MKKENTQSEIIKEKAIELFYYEGFKKTTLRKIANLSGIDHSSLFYYYANKAEIAKHLILRYFTGILKFTYNINKELFEGKSRTFMNYSLLFFAIHFRGLQEDKLFSNFYIDFYYQSKDVFNKMTDKVSMNLYKGYNEESFLLFYHDQPAEETDKLKMLNYALTSQVDVMLAEHCAKGLIDAYEASNYFANIIYKLPKTLWQIEQREIELFYRNHWKMIEKIEFDIYSDFLIYEKNEFPEKILNFRIK